MVKKLNKESKIEKKGHKRYPSQITKSFPDPKTTKGSTEHITLKKFNVNITLS